MTTTNYMLGAALVAISVLFFVKNPPSSASTKEAVEQLQRLNENLEKLYYQRSPIDMRFPVRADQKFSA